MCGDGDDVSCRAHVCFVHLFRAQAAASQCRRRIHCQSLSQLASVSSGCNGSASRAAPSLVRPHSPWDSLAGALQQAAPSAWRPPHHVSGASDDGSSSLLVMRGQPAHAGAWRLTPRSACDILEHVVWHARQQQAGSAAWRRLPPCAVCVRVMAGPPPAVRGGKPGQARTSPQPSPAATVQGVRYAMQ